MKFKNTTAGQIAAETALNVFGAGVKIDNLGTQAKCNLLREVAECDEREVLVSVIIAMLPREVRLHAALNYELACALRP